MSVERRARLRPLIIPDRKNVEFEPSTQLTQGQGGHLSPDLQPSTPPTFPTALGGGHSVSRIGDYLLLDPIDCNGPVHIYKSLHAVTHQEFTCKVIFSLNDLIFKKRFTAECEMYRKCSKFTDTD